MSELQQSVFTALEQLTPHELREIAERAQKAIVERSARVWTDAKETVDNLAASLGVSPQELFTRIYPVERTKAPVKYVDPANPKHTWTGRGPMPKWLKEQLATGRNVEEFAVKEVLMDALAEVVEEVVEEAIEEVLTTE